MPLIFVAGILLVVFIIGAMLYNFIATGYRQTIDRLTLENAKLETDKASLLERAQLLERQLDSVTTALEQKEREIERLKTANKVCEDGAAKKERTIEQALLDAGAVTEAGLEKARRFLEKTGTKREVHEVLVMLDLVSPQDVRAVKQTLGKD